MDKNQKLHHPLLHKTSTHSTTTTTTTTTDHATNIPSNSPGMIPRLILLFFVGAISLWANYESSKGFNLTILNEAGSNTFAGKRFNLFYISNDEISRLVLKTSQVIEDILYPSDNIYIKKQVNHVIIKLSSRNLTSSTEGNGGATKRVVVNSLNDHKYEIEISNLVMEGNDFRQAMSFAIQQGMAKVWLFNGDGNAPPNLVNGIVKYISEFSASNQALRSHKLTTLSEGFCWREGMDEDDVAKFLNYCGVNMEGFVRKLNQEMKDGWNDQMLQKNCKTSSSSPLRLINTSSNMESNV